MESLLFGVALVAVGYAVGFITKGWAVNEVKIGKEAITNFITKTEALAEADKTKLLQEVNKL